MKRLIAAWKMLQVLRSGENLGDAAALKLQIFSGPEELTPFSKAIIEHESINFEPLNLDALVALPSDTFGYAYAHFLKDNGLSPLNFSEKTRDLFAKNPVSLRYVRIHDMIHALLGFDTSIAGEIGVYAFIGAQKYCRTLNRAARFAHFMGWVFFWKLRAIRKAEKQALKMAETATTLIAVPLEQMLELRLDEAREKLGIQVSLQK